MNVRTVESLVTFRFPFRLADLEVTLPAGTYRLAVDEEEIPGSDAFHDAPSSAFRRVAAVLHAPAVTAAQINRKVLWIDPKELDSALAADGEMEPDLSPPREPVLSPGVSPPVSVDTPTTSDEAGAVPHKRSFLRRHVWSGWN